MSVAAFISRTRLWAGRRINADLQALCVNVIHQSLHIAKFLVGLDSSLLIANAFPTVIYIYVNIASILHAVAGNCIGGRSNISGRNFASKMIPAIPSHRRSCRTLGIGRSSRRYTAESHSDQNKRLLHTLKASRISVAQWRSTRCEQTYGNQPSSAESANYFEVLLVSRENDDGVFASPRQTYSPTIQRDGL